MNLHLSIVIPTLNSSKFIETSILKILDQLKTLNFKTEIIIINDYSEDNTFYILKNIKKKFTSNKINFLIINNKKRLNQYKSTIQGIKKSTGKYIITIDDDLSFKNEIIIELYYKFTTSKKIEILFGFLKKKNYLNSIARFFLTKINNHKIKSTSSIRIFNFISKKKIVSHYKKYTNFYNLITENFTKSKTIYFNYKNIIDPRKSNYLLLDKIKLFFLTKNILYKKIFSILFNILFLVILSIFIYISYLFFDYFFLSGSYLTGWISIISLLGLILIMNMLILLLISHLIIYKE